MKNLPASWEQVALSELVGSPATVDPGKTPDRKFELYSVPSFAGGRPEVVFGSEVKSIKQIVREGDVLLCKIVPHINRVWTVGPSNGNPQIASGEWIVYRGHGCDPGYLTYCLSEGSFRERFLETVSGVGGSLMRARPAAVAEIKVSVAPLSEQRRIVAKLDALTACTARARAELDRVPALAARYKQVVLVAAFTGKLTAEWLSCRSAQEPISPRAELDIRAKYRIEAPLPYAPPYEVPQAWRWLRLPQLGEIDRGKSRHRPRDDVRLFGGPYPFVQTGEIHAAERYLRHYSNTYSIFGLEQSRLWPRGTVCITIAANIAESAILGIDACFPDSVVGFIADSDRCLPEYVEYFIRTAKAGLEQFAPATAQKNINLEVLASIPIPLAPLDEQAEIVSRIDRAFGEIDRLTAEATAARRLLDRLDQAILAKAFRGELVPQDPNDEPASVLLERIRAERSHEPAARRRGRKPKVTA